MSNPNNARFVDMGGGNIAEYISFQIQMNYNPTTQHVRVVFNGAPYILMWDPLESTCRHASLSIL